MHLWRGQTDRDARAPEVEEIQGPTTPGTIRDSTEGGLGKAQVKLTHLSCRDTAW